tara:strand:+ start:608 stop:1765 length:1158 start_codon:yes stop_codon:yes gene_type:complete
MYNSLRFLIFTVITRVSQVVRVALAVMKNQVTAYPATVRKLEERFSSYTGSDHAMMFSNATSAMEAALFSVGANSASLVATSGYVIPSSYCSIVSFSSKIVFIDISEQTLNLDYAILSQLNPKPSILIVVHFYGNPCDMKSIMDWANQNNVLVIEDCSHAHGAKINGRMVGTWGHIGIFSLQGAKAVSAGEGALAITNCPETALKMVAYGHQESFKKFSVSKLADHKSIPPFGFGKKMRAHPIGAALALVDLKNLTYKNRIFEKWVTSLKELSTAMNSFSVPTVLPDSIRGGYCQGVPIIFRNEATAEKFISNAKLVKVNCFRRRYTDSIEYFSMKCNDDIVYKIKDELPQTQLAFDRVVFVPFYQFVHPLRWINLIGLLKKLPS